MKKILFLFIVMVLGAFASPLFAIDNIKVGCATSPPQAVKSVNETNDNTYATFAKVNILHKDTLMYSWTEGQSKKIIVKNDGTPYDEYIRKTDATLVTFATFEVGWQSHITHKELV